MCTASIAADSIVDAISFITDVLFCDQKTSFSQIRLRLRPNLSSDIRPNSASAEFEKVKFGATLVLTDQDSTAGEMWSRHMISIVKIAVTFDGYTQQ